MPNAARPDGALLVHQVHPPLPQGSPSCVHQPPPSPCHLSRSQITHILPIHKPHLPLSTIALPILAINYFDGTSEDEAGNDDDDQDG